MKILLVENLTLSTYLRDIGHTVFTSSFSEKSDFPISEYNFKLARLCAEKSIDILIQMEILDKRIVIIDIHEISCLKIYYAIDVHLNYYWQKHYSRLFDLFVSSQKNFTEYHEKNFQQKSIWLPWGADNKKEITFKPFKKRKYTVSFVGVIDKNRLKRKNIVNTIEKKHKLFISGDKPENKVSYDEMLNIYSDSKIVINESINNEINFRYFEATYAGALLFTEEINNGENLLFKPDEEILTFNCNNMLEKLSDLLKDEKSAEKIAFQGFKKTRNMHTLQNRVATLLKTVEEYSGKIISENMNAKRKTILIKVLFFLTLRMIGDRSYLKILSGLFDETQEYEDIYVILAKFFLIKREDASLSVKFLKKIYEYNKHPLIFLNITATLYEIGDFKNNENIFHEFLKIVPKLIKEGIDYFQGFINFRKTNIILTAFDVVSFLFTHFKKDSMHHKTLNLHAAKILISANNYQGAIFYLQNNIRYFPENILSRKYLSICFKKLYANELYELENLKIMLLEREFQLFRKCNVKNELKKIAILDIIEHSQSKKLIRDITFNLNDYIAS